MNKDTPPSVIVVIGAGLIGQAIARRVSAGKHVVLADLRPESAETAAKIFKDAGFSVSTTMVDVSSRESVQALVVTATALGDVTGVIHAAGVSPSQAAKEVILKVDLYGTALVLEEFGKVIAPGGSGIVIASMSGHRLPALSAEENKLLATTPVEELLALPMLQPDRIRDSLHAYQVSKRGNSLRVMAEAVNWGKRGARVNTISPGIIITPLANDELNGPRGEGYAAFLAAIHPEDRDKTDRLVQQALDPQGGLTFETEFRTHHENSEGVRWLRATGKTSLNLSGEVDRFSGTVLDITDMVKARESLAERRDQLQLLVEQRTVELRNTVGELQAFSYSVSHDMRSPLRAMQGFSQALLDDYSDKLDESGKDYLNRIERGAKRLDLLIQDVLSYSTVANSEIDLRPVDLPVLLAELCSHHPDLQEPQATITLEGDLPVVLAHEAFLSQILTNLLGNAVKFQMPGSKPLVTISAEPSGNRIRVWVKDNGMGIDPSHHTQIFGIFGRVYPGKTYDGTGIGLAIVKKAVSRMGGEVGLESALGKGSQFWFSLQLNETR